jgi:rhodanese-related sulfurtransferase
MQDAFEIVDVAEARLEVADGTAVAVDARSAEEWGRGHLRGAIHLPKGELGAAGVMLENGARLIVIADDYKASAEAAVSLQDEGYDAVAVNGGMNDWISQRAPG